MHSKLIHSLSKKKIIHSANYYYRLVLWGQRSIPNGKSWNLLTILRILCRNRICEFPGFSCIKTPTRESCLQCKFCMQRKSIRNVHIRTKRPFRTKVHLWININDYGIDLTWFSVVVFQMVAITSVTPFGHHTNYWDVFKHFQSNVHYLIWYSSTIAEQNVEEYGSLSQALLQNRNIYLENVYKNPNFLLLNFYAQKAKEN